MGPHRRVQLIKIGLLASLAAMIGVVLYFAAPHLSIETLADREIELRAWIRSHAIAAVMLGLAIYSVVCIFPGTPGKTFVYGWLFGFWQGVVIVNLGLTIGACTAFCVSRYLLRDAVESRIPVLVFRLNRALERNGPTYMLTLRLIFVPFTVLNFALGATGVRLRTFWWTTQLGMLPSNIVFVYAASRLPSLRQIADEGAASLYSTELLVLLIALSVLPLLARRIATAIFARRAEDTPAFDNGVSFR